MSKKLSLGLAPLLAVAALTVIPAAAQGACTTQMAKLLGVETVTTPTTRSVTTVIAAVNKQVSATGGTLEEILFKTTSAQVEGSLQVGIYEDNAGAPGKLLAKKTVTAAAGEHTVAVTGFSVTLTKGVTYWLAILGVSGGKASLFSEPEPTGEETTRRTSVTETELVETASWAEAKKQGPYEFWANGTAPTCPHAHVYKNGTIGAEGKPVRDILWGTLKLENEHLAELECHNIYAGFLENPVGGSFATGKLQAFYPYECVSANCTVHEAGTLTVTSGTTVPWRTEVFEPKAGEFWEKIGFKGPTPNKKVNPETEPGQTELHWGCSTIGGADFFGELDAKIPNNGISIGALPAELQFFKASQNPNSHALESELFGNAEIESGSTGLKIEGYGAQELIEVQNP